MTKLYRAQEHLQTLEAEIGVFQRHKPYEFTNDLESEPGKVLLRFHLTEEPRQRWAVILGDIAHNLRSALDHLAWQLVEANGGKPGWETKFPIYQREPDYVVWRTPRPESDPTGKRSDPFESVDQRVIDAIEDLQPYTRGSEAKHHPLAVLSATSNRDKHRLLIPMLGGVDSRGGAVQGSFHLQDVTLDGPIWAPEGEGTFWLNDGSIVARGTITPPNTHGYIHLNSHVTLDVTFPKGGGLIVPTMTGMITFVREEVFSGLRNFL